MSRPVPLAGEEREGENDEAAAGELEEASVVHALKHTGQGRVARRRPT